MEQAFLTEQLKLEQLHFEGGRLKSYFNKNYITWKRDMFFNLTLGKVTFYYTDKQLKLTLHQNKFIVEIIYLTFCGNIGFCCAGMVYGGCKRNHQTGSEEKR